MSTEARDTFTITAEVLAKHAAYRRGEEGGERLVAPYGARVVLAEGVSLARADLAGAYLAGAYLAGADLARADLADANLARADLAGAYLAGAYLARADLAGAYLADANLADANLARARNVPTGLDASPREPEAVPVIPHIDAAILARVEGPAADGTLDMSRWHGERGICGTTHCRAGWTVVLAGERGKELEAKHGTPRAASLIYRASRPGKPAPHWYATTERAMEDLRRCAAEDPLLPEKASAS